LSTAQEAQSTDVDEQQHPFAQTSEPAQWKQFTPDKDADRQRERAEHVREAINDLKKIRSPTSTGIFDFSRQPKGMLSYSLYYAKEAFFLLFMSGPTAETLLMASADTSPPTLARPLSNAIGVLQDTASEGDPDAIYVLAEVNFHGNFSHPINYEEAFKRYKQLADLNGNSTAQYMLGFVYATGLNPAVLADQAKSMLYHTFAAEQGNTRSQMTLAYRSHAGIASMKDCEEAVHWYKKVADKAVEYYRSGPIGGHVLVRNAYRLAEEDGGVYGEGASASSAGVRARQGGPTSDINAHMDDVLEYLHLQSTKGDIKATYAFARSHYDGSKGVKRDLKVAKRYFMSIARQYWTENGKVEKNVSQTLEKVATLSAGYLGRMFLRGEGTEQSYAKAKVWFTRGISNSDGLSQYSLGLMHLHGLGVSQDVQKAADLFTAAAEQHIAVAQTNLGRLLLDQGQPETAAKYFELAAKSDHIEAFYYTAEMNNNGIGMDRSCEMAATRYKIVAEKAEPVWSSLQEANQAYEEGNTRKALIGYMMAAEQGSENAQANVAWLLDHTKPRWSPLTLLSSFRDQAKTALGDAATALIYWTRSAKQHNVDSIVKMGDFYLSGIGTYFSAENAAACYQSATETLPPSAQAMWNLGWMHENGLGINQDFHLAKRYYDQALDTNKEAYLPVQLSLWKLRWRSWWNHVTGGGVNGIEDDEDQAKKSPSFAEWVQRFLEADAEQYKDLYEADDWDASHEEMLGGDDYWEEGDIDDSVLDALLIGGLLAALGWLIYYRQRQQRAAEQRRRQGVQEVPAAAPGEGEQRPPRPALPGQQPDGGFFPQPGDPNRNAWLAGGFGP